MISKLLKKIISLSIMSTFLFGLTSCVENKAPSKTGSSIANNVSSKVTNVKYPAKEEKIKYRNKDTVDSINKFASTTSYNVFDSYKTTDKNLNYSPISLFYTLSLLASGSNGQTEKELMSLLQFEGKDKTYLSEESNKLFKSLYQNDTNSKLLIANSLWLQNGFKFKNEYTENAEKNYYASLFNIDFSKQEDMDKISGWVKENTNDIFNPKFTPSKDIILSAINAIYFKSSWTKEFDSKNNFKDKFYISENEDIECEYMKTNFKTYKYFKGDNYTSSYLYMKNSTMYFILPDKGVNVYDLVSNENDLKEIIDFVGKPINGENVRLDFSLPKFKIKSSINFEEILEKLGCKSLLNGADFSGMSHDKLKLSSIGQENFIEVNEKGAEASAYTKGDMMLPISVAPSKYINFVLDRPYIYILTAENGTILFVGICNNPTC